MKGLRRLAAILCVLLVSCAGLESDDRRARRAVEEAAAAGFRFELPDGALLEIPAGRLEAVGVTAFPLEDRRLRAFARISLEGRVDGMPISYVGDEKFVVSCAGGCRLAGAPAPRLLELLAVLRERRAALAAGDRERLAAVAVPEAGPQLARADLRPSAERRPSAWFIRIDREEALVGEALEGGGTRQLVLRSDGAGWRFVSGLP